MMEQFLYGIVLLSPAFFVLLKWYALVCIYVILCTIVANIGGKRLVGFWGTLLFSLLLTPILVWCLLILLDRSKQQRQEQ